MEQLWKLGKSRERVLRMDIKITGKYAVYQNAVNSGRKLEKNTAAPAGITGGKSDEICISSDAVKKQEASVYSSAVCDGLAEAASEERIAQLKQQIGDGTYHVSAELVAKKLMAGL